VTNWILRWFFSGVALAIVAHLGIGVTYDSLSALATATVVIGLVNSLIRPIVGLFTLPLNCATLGLFGVLVNALLFFIAGNAVHGFHVEFWPGAVVGPILMGLFSGLLTQLIPDKKDRD
jgi:putative membrane protein